MSRWIWIWRPGLNGATAGGAGSPGTFSRGGARLGSSEFIGFDAPGIKMDGTWVREVARNMANSTGYIGWGIGVS